MIMHDTQDESDSLVPEPRSTIFDSVNRAIGDEATARQVYANPQLAGTLAAGTSGTGTRQFDSVQHKRTVGTRSTPLVDDAEPQTTTPATNRSDDVGEDDSIALQAVDEIGRATAVDVREALHQVIDPELGIDVIDLGLVYGIEIDKQGRAIITMTLTTPACPLTDLIEDECASTLAGLVEEFRIDWTWEPLWTTDKITPEGRDQLAAIGFNLENMPKY